MSDVQGTSDGRFDGLREVFTAQLASGPRRFLAWLRLVLAWHHRRNGDDLTPERGDSTPERLRLGRSPVSCLR